MAKTLTMLRGLPGCGKSTWSLQQVEESKGGTKRISKDDLRAMLDGGKWSRDNEKFVLKMRDHIAIEALQAGKHVIIDDTGFAEFHEVNLRALAGKYGAQFQIQDFTRVSIETCIERDLKRQHSVGESVIRKMWRQYLAPKPPVIEYDPKKPSVYICDLDGTLCLMNGRGPYEGDKCDTDIVNEPVAHTLAQLRSANENVIFVSGRFEAVREKSIQWLKDHGIDYAPILFMRKDGDMREDSIIKEEIYRDHIAPYYNVIAVFDDRRRVVDATRALGYTVFHVTEGDF